VTDTALMDIFNTRNELQIKFTSLFLGESGVPHDVVEQLSAIAVLHDHVELFFGLDDLVKLNNIWMSDLLKNFNFSRNALHIFLIMDLILF
jgi:hypothetical protein